MGVNRTTSILDVADSHRRMLAYALLALGGRYAVSAIAAFVDPGLATVLGRVADGLALLAVGLVVWIFFWKGRNLSGDDRHMYEDTNGFVARTIATAQSISWIVTFLVLVLLEPFDRLSEAMSTAVLFDVVLATMIFSFAGAYFYLDRSPAEAHDA